jgi:hypothetical protein
MNRILDILHFVRTEIKHIIQFLCIIVLGIALLCFGCGLICGFFEILDSNHSSPSITDEGHSPWGRESRPEPRPGR